MELLLRNKTKERGEVSSGYEPCKLAYLNSSHSRPGSGPEDQPDVEGLEAVVTSKGHSSTLKIYPEVKQKIVPP